MCLVGIKEIGVIGAKAKPRVCRKAPCLAERTNSKHGDASRCLLHLISVSVGSLRIIVWKFGVNDPFQELMIFRIDGRFAPFPKRSSLWYILEGRCARRMPRSFVCEARV